jgi:hypothetical protein
MMGERSQLWNKIKSDVLGVLIKNQPGDLATWGSPDRRPRGRVFPDLAAAAKSCAKAGEVREPDNSAHLAYRAYSALYAHLFDTNRETFSALARISQQATKK